MTGPVPALILIHVRLLAALWLLAAGSSWAQPRVVPKSVGRASVAAPVARVAPRPAVPLRLSPVLSVKPLPAPLAAAPKAEPPRPAASNFALVESLGKTKLAGLARRLWAEPDGSDRAFDGASEKERERAYLAENLSPVNTEVVPPTSAELARRWKPLEKRRYWDKWIEDRSDFVRFVRRKDYFSAEPMQHGTGMYGVDHYRAWKNADDFLQAIPKGRLELSLALFQEAHRRAAEGFRPRAGGLLSFLPAGLASSDAGAFKRRRNFGIDPVLSPLSEQQYQALKSNEHLSFWELPGPLSRLGRRRGVIAYPEPEEAGRKMDELVSWYSRNKETMDPVELAARFQHAFVSIHPFVDGNGRTSRLIMDRILAERGLPPALLLDSTADLYQTPEDWTRQVRAGVEEFLEPVYHSSRDEVPGPPQTHREVKLWRRISTPENRDLAVFANGRARFLGVSEEIKLGGRRFVLRADGFFYDHKLIPYVYREGVLYPITDRTYGLYFQNGDRKAPNSLEREISPWHADVVRRHLALIKGVFSGRVRPAAVEVKSRDAIVRANQADEFSLYAWQKDLLRYVIAIREDHPVLALKRAGRRQTEFEFQPERGESDIIAQYQKTDFEFYGYQKAAESEAPELVPEILESRRKIHSAARKLLSPYSNPSPIVRAYVSMTKLAFADFDEAVARQGDDHEVLLRADNSVARFVGLRSQHGYRDLFESLPFASWLRVHVRPGVVDWSKREWPESLKLAPKVLRMLLRYVLSTRFANRGIGDAFERPALDDYLHMNDHDGKKGLSFTSSIALLAGSVGENFPFVQKGFSSRLYLARVPKNAMRWNAASFFSKEYEFIVTRPIPPWDIVRSYAPDEVRPSARFSPPLHLKEELEGELGW
jgi:prophage maintenance system killer protein